MDAKELPRSKFYISKYAVGKVQAKSMADVLRFERTLWNDISGEALLSLIKKNTDLEKWVAGELPLTKLGKKLIAAATAHSTKEMAKEGRVHISPSELRAVLFNLFSSNQRAGGSRISGYPLIEIDSKTGLGLEAIYEPRNEVEIAPPTGKRGTSPRDKVRFSGYHMKIGRPYAKRLKQVTSLMAKAIDKSSANLSNNLTKLTLDRQEISVEALSAWCRENFNRLKDKPNSRGRFISKIDFFLYPPPVLREQILKHPSIDKRLSQALRDSLQKGQYCLSAFDISGGGAGVGVSEAVAKHWGYDSSGNLETYLDCLLREFDRQNRASPTQVLVMPSKTDLKTFNTIEFTPLSNAFKKRGYPCHIVTCENYEDQLSKNPKRVEVKSIEGNTVMVGEKSRTLIVRRYTYLYEGQTSRGTIRRHPPGTTVLPSDESRIIASDCRVNLRMLEHVTRALRGGPDGGHSGGLQIIPFTFLKLDDSNASYAAQGFLASCMDQWPEVKYLGGVVKPVDKVPVSEAGVVRSAYPLPPIPTTEHVLDIMVKPLFENLLAKGVDEVVVMPNVLPVVVDQNLRVLPKFEIRMISLCG